MDNPVCKSPTSTMVSGQKNYLFRGTDEWSPNCSYFRRASRKSFGLPSSATWQWIDGMMSEVTIQWLQPKTPHMAIGTNSFPVSHGDPVCSVRIYTYTEDTYSMCCIHIYYIYIFIELIINIYMKECLYSLNSLYIYTHILILCHAYKIMQDCRYPLFFHVLMIPEWIPRHRCDD